MFDSIVSIWICIGFSNILDFNVSLTLLIKSASTICWIDQMGKAPRWRGRWRGPKTSAENNNPLSESSRGYKAPTVWCKGALYLHITTKAAPMFRVVNIKLHAMPS